jgi:hypothetical protein
MTATRSLHVPAVARRADGTWGVWCVACSEREQDYTYPCDENTRTDDWPPDVLVEPTP